MRFIIILLVCLLYGVLGAEELSLTVLQTTDIHSKVFKDGANQLRLAALIKQVRTEAGGTEKSMLIDCGDLFQGTIEGSVSQGLLSPSILKACSYDAWIFGNHDFDFGVPVLIDAVKAFGGDCFAANLVSSYPELKYKAWKIYEKNGIRIALIGMSPPYMEQWYAGDLLKGLKFRPITESLGEIMPEIMKAKPDIIILAVHHGMFAPERLDDNENMATLIKEFPQVNLILGGHTHIDEAGKRLGRSSLYVQAGKYAEKLARVDIVYDTTEKKIVSMESSLIPVPVDGVEDPDSERVAEPFQKATEQYSNKIFGVSENDFKSFKGSLNSSWNNLLALASMKAVDCQAALISAIRHPEIRQGGSITGQAVYEMMPFENRLCTIELTAQELRAVIREMMDFQKDGNCQVLYGLRIDLDKEGNCLSGPFYPDGSPLAEDTRIKVVMHNYAAAGAGGRFKIIAALKDQKETAFHDSGILVRKALECYISSNSPLAIPETEFMLLKKVK